MNIYIELHYCGIQLLLVLLNLLKVQSRKNTDFTTFLKRF